MANEEEEKPVDFIPELNVFGQPIQKEEAPQPIPDKSKYRFGLEPAIPIDRFLAGVIDILIVALVCYFIFNVWLFPNDIVKKQRLAKLISIVIGCLYHGFFDSSEWQGTPGKRLLGIKISKNAGGRISFFNAAGRYLVSLISIAVLLLGYLNVFINENRKAWHDIIAGTYVIRDKELDDVAHKKKRKNGYIIAVIIVLIYGILLLNAYTLETDIRNQKLAAEQQRLEKIEQQKNSNSVEKTARIIRSDSLFNDSIHGFSILLKKGFRYSTSSPSFNFISIPDDSNHVQIGWMVVKLEVPDTLYYGTYLSKHWNGNENIRVSDIKLIPYKEGYGIEQGNLRDIKSNGDTVFCIVRAYIKNKTCYLVSIINYSLGKPIVANKITQQIFTSFQIAK